MTVADIVRPMYNALVRDRLPRKWAVYGDIPARDARLLDVTDHVEHYKSGLRKAIDAHVEDDRVVLVGGGRGVSSCWLADAGADVVAYEAAETMVEIARQTVALQGHADAVDVRHALVGEAVDIYGELAGADVVHPADLETGDVLIMDCEGAERSILHQLADWPPTVIVETHPEHGVETDWTRTQIVSAGYDVTSLQYEPDRPNKRILVGDRR